MTDPTPNPANESNDVTEPDQPETAGAEPAAAESEPVGDDPSLAADATGVALDATAEASQPVELVEAEPVAIATPAVDAGLVRTGRRAKPAKSKPAAPAKPVGPTRPTGPYAIIETGGKQYRVSVGETISVERLAAEAGADLTIDRVLLLGGDGATRVGTPIVDGATVTARVDDHLRGEKIVVFKYKAKKRYRRRIGHRQELTRLTITSIQG